MTESTATDSLAPADDPQLDYKVPERWAILGLLLGVFSPLSLLAPILWLAPLFGIAANAVALRRIKLDANLVGRNAALLGLALSIVFSIAPPAEYLTSYVMLSRQARETANQWFEYLRQGSPEKALMLDVAPDDRQPIGDELWIFYRHDAEANRNLRGFVQHPLVRTLLALGDKADVRFYKTTTVATSGTLAQVSYWYTVTYLDQGRKKTFFIRVLMERKPTQKPGENPWRVRDFFGGFDPTTSPV